ncbi:gamma-glutamyl hydrolase-like isoform X2 [Dermatophagoides pteronyssinus]|uniref:folate gamma-glutamyl hydrolase n=1 Tax=Dermatophagoides pteronyssinus TaxID=6956 RepID=A0A6P6XV46_DERPT|nr:gamma-glutamyl hydrolase-like isoform X2 [Dermatophagoides pteronyssinus]
MIIIQTILINFFIIIVTCYDNDIDEKFPIKNDRVVIGVLAQYPYQDEHQFIVASYVKFLESSGARVVPVFCGRKSDYYETLLPKLNGILLPGGGSPLDKGPYAETVDLIIETSKKFYDEGKYFPIWATCLSFEKLIVHFLNGDLQWKSMCHAQNIALNLEIEKSVIDNPKSVRMFRDMDLMMPNIFDILQNNNVTPNYHRVCLELDEWNKHQELKENFQIIGHNLYKNYTFVSMIEHKKYPIYASIWHPEKIPYEFVINEHMGNFNHYLKAIMVSQYFGNFFVNEARRSCGKFDNKLDESQHLIYNYNEYRKYTGNDGKSSYEETFIFPTNVNNGSSSLSTLTKGYYNDNYFKYRLL